MNSFIGKIIEKATKEIMLIDNYIDINTLNILCKKNNGVNINIYTSGKGNLTIKDINKFNTQYPTLTEKTNTDFHDKFFLLLANTEVYHVGTSIKDAGKKSFDITKIEDKDLIESLLKRVR